MRPPPETAINKVNMPFIRNLASSDSRTRTAALESLSTFLNGSTRSSRLTYLDYLKLWKGLYYSLWMCDRPLPQQKLCTELGQLIHSIPGKATGWWLSAFWEIIGGEWTSIDALRLEKFLLLVRCVLGTALKWITGRLPGPPPPELKDGEEEGEEEALERWVHKDITRKCRKNMDGLLDSFASWPLETEDNLSLVPVGLRLHVLDIWVDEMEKVGFLDHNQTWELGREFLDRLRLLVEAQTRSTCKPVRLRAKESLADDRLPWNKSETVEGETVEGETVEGETGEDEASKTGENNSGDKDSWNGFDD